MRHSVGRWAGTLSTPLRVLHVGDLDPDGLAIFGAAAEDVEGADLLIFRSQWANGRPCWALAWESATVSPVSHHHTKRAALCAAARRANEPWIETTVTRNGHTVMTRYRDAAFFSDEFREMFGGAP